MNSEMISAIVRCAFKICCIYFLKCFLPVIKFGSSGHVHRGKDRYDLMLRDQIKVMGHLLSSERGDVLDFTKTDNLKDEAYGEIKKKITSRLKEQYGDNICIDFTYDEAEDCKKDKVLYSLKVKELGKNDPDEKDFEESEIFVNTKTKTFGVRTSKGFRVFPLAKRSVVRCEKS